MNVSTTQVAMKRGDRHYSGLFSVSGSTLIIRVPGMGSRSTAVGEGDDPAAVAKRLLEEIVMAAERSGMTA